MGERYPTLLSSIYGLNNTFSFFNCFEKSIGQVANYCCSCFPGIGYEILVDMLRYIAPSHVVKINISAESKNLPAGEFWLEEEEDCGTTNLIEMRSARQDAFNRS